ncbi:MAG: orotidine-5'-phosphate decarboxylase [Leptospirales bacterium]|nr:orotidine-5'-phosphate decarboxylase [Leptospirales bacterium]
MSTFYDRFVTRRDQLQSTLCVGLDPDPEKFPAGYAAGGDIINETLLFLGDVVEATAPFTVAYKPNLAFFERLGSQGFLLFETLIRVIRSIAPGALIIADAKRGDVGSTAEHYAAAYFDSFGCDAMTVSPYMGMDTVTPFQRYADRGIIVLCHTSNPGAPEFQAQGDPPLYLRVAKAVEQANRESGNLWLVVGATRSADSIASIRAAAPSTPFLIPGVGAQGGDLAAAMSAAGRDCLVNVSRAILYAGEHRDVVPRVAAAAARDYATEMRRILEVI